MTLGLIYQYKQTWSKGPESKKILWFCNHFVREKINQIVFVKKISGIGNAALQFHLRHII